MSFTGSRKKTLRKTAKRSVASRVAAAAAASLSGFGTEAEAIICHLYQNEDKLQHFWMPIGLERKGKGSRRPL